MVDLFAARFRHEAQAAGRLTHPGIVGIYEYGEDAGYTCIAMEFVEGHSLREYFQRKVPFEEKDVVSLMSQLPEALQAAHEQGVWHRNIKPANLVVTNADKLKIADFGIARVDWSELTQVSEMLGTPGYIAPERYQGLPVDHRTDLFVAGSVFYQMLSWEAPFTGPAEAVMYRVCSIDPRPPSQRDTDRCWTDYDLVVATPLAKEPGRRYQSAAEFRAAVLDAYAKPVVSAISETTIIAARASLPVVGTGTGAGRGSLASAGGASATARRRGRGATIDPAGRFDTVVREAFDDGWSAADPHADPDTPAPRIVPTVVAAEQAMSIISRNRSPDVPFDRSINPYRGREHGCIYCYARPSHGYLGLSPGLDFETRLFARINAAQRLREELSAPSYECGVIALGANTDPYHPCEREWKVTRQVIEVLVECSHPF